METKTTSGLPRVVPVKEVAQALGCSETFVRSLISDGTLSYLDISRRGASRAKIRVPAKVVEAYIDRELRRAPRP